MKFFFYGIFLSKRVRHSYGILSEPEYDTVLDYATFGDHIVTAVPIPNHGLCLTGIVVDVPLESIPDIDALEGGYDRITVATTSGVQVEMYVQPEEVT